MVLIYSNGVAKSGSRDILVVRSFDLVMKRLQ